MEDSEQLELARELIKESVSAIMEICGNSYANAWCEQWLQGAKKLGVYHGRTIGNIVELKDEWELYMEANQ